MRYSKALRRELRRGGINWGDDPTWSATTVVADLRATALLADLPAPDLAQVMKHFEGLYTGESTGPIALPHAASVEYIGPPPCAYCGTALALDSHRRCRSCGAPEEGSRR